MRKGKFTLIFRDRLTGKFASKAQFQERYIKLKKPRKPKEKPKEKEMRRCTLTVALIYSGQRDHKYKHVRVTAWSTDQGAAEKLARDKLDEFASGYCKTGLWEDFNEANSAVEKVEYDSELVGGVVVVDETKHS